MVTLILVGILFRVFAAAASQWQAADQRIDTFRDARAALQIMTRDLSRADINGNTQMLTLSDIYSVPNPPFAKEAYAITPIPNTGKSDLCTVGYYCSYDATTHAYSLETLSKTALPLSTRSPLRHPTLPAIFEKNNPDPDEIVAAYVWDLQFHPGIGKDLVAPSTSSSQWTWLEIRFKSMSTASGRKIRNTPIDLSTWFDATSPLYMTHILPYEQQFVGRTRPPSESVEPFSKTSQSGFALVITLITIAFSPSWQLRFWRVPASIKPPLEQRPIKRDRI